MIWKLVWSYVIGRALLGWLRREQRDHTAMLQGWIDRAAATGASVRLHGNRYNLSNTITVPAQVTASLSNCHFTSIAPDVVMLRRPISVGAEAREGEERE